VTGVQTCALPISIQCLVGQSLTMPLHHTHPDLTEDHCANSLPIASPSLSPYRHDHRLSSLVHLCASRYRSYTLHTFYPTGLVARRHALLCVKPWQYRSSHISHRSPSCPSTCVYRSLCVVSSHHDLSQLICHYVFCQASCS